MDRNTRSRIYLLVLMIAIFVVWKFRQNQPKEVYLQGITMGVIAYNIKYLDADQRNFKREIDSLLTDFNQALSTYIPNSEISRFNNEGTIEFGFPYFYKVLQASEDVFNKTRGAFDPTVGPLIDAWGFGEGEMIGPDSAQVDSLLTYVGFDKITFNENELRSQQEFLKLNFSAIAKGQAIDVVFDFLRAQGYEDIMVEIGGEVRAIGENLEGSQWVIGIEVPDESRIGGIFDALYLNDRGMATSGNYRNFRVLDDGRKVAHTINPSTGYPQLQTLLSATVLAPSCMYADAYATACMVLGLEKSKELIESDAALEAYFIYAGPSGEIETFISSGLVDLVVGNESQ